MRGLWGWSGRPRMFHTKRARRSIKCLSCCGTHQLPRHIARRNLRVGDETVEGGRLESPRNWQLARAAPAQVPREHSSGACPSNQPQPSQLVQSTCCVCLECIVVLVIMYSHRSPCSRSGAQVSHQSVHRMTDVGQEHVNFARLNEPRQGRHTGVQFLFW